MALKSSGTLYLTGTNSQNGIAFHFTGTAPHKLSEYYGVGFDVPSRGTLKFSDFYGEEIVRKYSNGNQLIAHFTVGESARGQQFYRHVYTARSSTALNGFKVSYSFHFGGWTKHYTTVAGKNRTQFANQNHVPTFAEHYHNKYLDHGRYRSTSGNFTKQGIKFKASDRLDFAIRMWGGFGGDRIGSGNIKVYL